MWKLGLLGVVAIASEASAAPVYLDCPIASPSGRNAVHLDLTLNEDAGTVGVLYRETGKSVQGLTATFTPDDVSWARPDADGLGRTEWHVSRTSLAISETMYIGANPMIARTGTCEVRKIDQDRKF
jgi:hypothetical protein